MAASFLNRLGILGMGIACVGGVVNTALFNGNMNFYFENFSHAESQFRSVELKEADECV